MWRRKIIIRCFNQSYRPPYMMGKEEKLGILASSNSSSLVDPFLGRLYLFPFPIAEELVEYTISSFSTLLMMSSQSTIKLSLVSHRPVLSSDTKKSNQFSISKLNFATYYNCYKSVYSSIILSKNHFSCIGLQGKVYKNHFWVYKNHFLSRE